MENIKEGYKDTTMGVIPEDWLVKRIEELVTIQNGRGYSHLEKGDIPVYASGGIINYVDKYLYEGISIGIGRKGTIDKPQLLTGKYWVIDTLFFMNNFKDVYPYFLYSKFHTINWYRYNESSGLPSLIKNTIKKIQLPIPPLPEQKAIANCLTTWDSGIEKLTALIKAKKEQKKGLMQQLLTGEKRLDGFEEEWREITLGDIGVFKTSSVNKKIEENETKVWLLNYMDVYRNTHISSKIKFQLTSAKQSQISSTNLKVGDVLFTPSSETPDDIGHSAVVIENLENVVYSYHLVRFRVKKNILDINFSGYVFNKSEILNEFSRRATGSTRYTLSVKDFNEVTTFLPPLKEQSKIAEVLTTADKEITLLEKKLEGFKEQKRGLMQVLLTGERRLIENC